MEQYIDKSAVVAEIEKRIIFNNTIHCYAREDECNAILSFLDNLEVKKVDLEEECKNYLENNFNSAEEPDEFLTTVMQLDDMVLFAKHFFELGLKAKGE